MSVNAVSCIIAVGYS